MKSLRIAAVLSLLVLSASTAFAGKATIVPLGGPESSSGENANACFAVYCDGAYSGYVVCSDTLGGVIAGAEFVCSAS